MLNAWIKLFECNFPQKEKIIEALTMDGFTAVTFRNNVICEHGIIFFSQISIELSDFLRETSCSGLKRVLAISVDIDALDNGGAWSLLQAGASDVFAFDTVERTATKIAMRFRRWDAVDKLLSSPLIQDSIIGDSPAWRAVLRQIVEVAHFTSAAFLITGESGTGKELVARLVHTLDSRSDKRDLTILDCTTIVPELSGSEFFGHERGAFTGAVTARDGAFALADGGTLFLDEVGELPLKLQAQLLRVVQEHKYKRVGGNTWHSTDFRLVCATNRNLFREVKNGNFRSDLYYRIANWTCTLPPLRERTEDIILLARYFIKQFKPEGEQPDIDKPVREYLPRREYPGNVRDLKQLLSRIMHRYVGKGPITVGDIPEEERPKGEFDSVNWCDDYFERAIRKALLLDVGLKEIRRTTEKSAINLAINEENGNLQRAAKKLGITDRALQMRRAVDRRQNQDNNDESKDDKPSEVVYVGD